MVTFNFILILILTLLINIFSQTNNIESESDTLIKLRDEIKKLEFELEDSKRKEKISYNFFLKLNKQKHYIQKIINQLSNQEIAKANQINKLKEKKNKLEQEIKNLKSNYTKIILFNYKYGGISKLELIFNAKSFRQALLRIKYLRDISNRKQTQLKLLNKKISEINFIEIYLLKEIEKLRLISAEKENELNFLKEKIELEKNIIAELKKDRKAISEQIAEKRKSEIEIKNLIEKLIIEEQKKISIVQDNFSKDKQITENFEQYHIKDDLSENLTPFFELKGKLPFPVVNGRVISSFGSRKNIKLGTITFSNGIDILSPQPIVRSISDGVVSAIEWLPGYGTVVIISHKGDFKTVYGNLENIQVIENQKISAGNVIGFISSGLEGTVLHFQLWNGRQSLNPLVWLKNN